MFKTWMGEDVKVWKDRIEKHHISVLEEDGMNGFFIGKDYRILSDGIPMWKNLKIGTRIYLNCVDAEHAVKNGYADYVFEGECGFLKGGSDSVDFYSFSTNKEEKHYKVNLPSHILKEMGWNIHDVIDIWYDKSRGIVELQLELEKLNIVKDKEEIYSMKEVRENLKQGGK